MMWDLGLRIDVWKSTSTSSSIPPSQAQLTALLCVLLIAIGRQELVRIDNSEQGSFVGKES